MTKHEGRRFSVPATVSVDGREVTVRVWSHGLEEPRPRLGRYTRAIRARIRTIRRATADDDRLNVTSQGFYYRRAILALYDLVEPELDNMSESDVKRLHDLITVL